MSRSSLFGLITLLILTGYGETPFYGITAHMSRPGWDLEYREREFAILKNSPVRWVRTDFDWSLIENKRNEWHFEHLDRIRENAKRDGIRILPILARRHNDGRDLKRNQAEWLAYIRRTVSRYKDDFRCWEIINEQNLIFSGRDYAEYLKLAYGEIKKIDPGLQVVLGGLFMVPIPWLEAFFQAGGAECFDIMNIHPYAPFFLPEYNIPRFRALKKLMQKYHATRKPVWITELGNPTNFQPGLHGKIVRAAMQHLKINSSEIPLVCAKDIQAVLPEDIRHQFREVIFLPLSGLKNLDPEQYPVVMPVVGERFYFGHHDTLAEYVRKGGTLLLLYGIPFYYEIWPDGTERQVNEKYMKQFHISWDTWWFKKSRGVPRREDIHSVAPEFRSFLQLEPEDFPSRGERGRFLSERNLEPGDQLIPMIMGTTKEYSAPVCGIYQLNSSMKGAIVLFCIRHEMKGVSEAYQAAFLARNIIIANSSGMDMFFIYNLRSRELRREDSESYYGLLRKDLTPKPAFHALENLGALLPDCRHRPILKRYAESWTAEWIGPSGKKVWAVWSELPEENREISVQGTVSAAYDLYGKRMGFQPGIQKISFAPFYLVGPSAVSLR